MNGYDKMTMSGLAYVISIAFLCDLIFGDPQYRFHPIRIIGRAIALLEGALRGLGLDGRAGGVSLVLMAEVISVGSYLLAALVLYRLSYLLGLCLDVFICYSCLALKDLINHITPVIHNLETGDLAGARRAVSLVVGRDVRYLDGKGVARAAVETLAENFVDGFLSPLFWYVTGGTIGILVGTTGLETALGFMLGFKVASTLDSMVGYKNPEFYRFGWAAARLDDLMNFVPARLSLILLFAGSVWTARLHPLDGLRVAMRDRLRHDSPNAAHPESFVAGALHVRLGGPTRYPDRLSEKAWLGEGYPDPGTGDIRSTVSLLKASAWISLTIVLCILFCNFSISGGFILVTDHRVLLFPTCFRPLFSKVFAA